MIRRSFSSEQITVDHTKHGSTGEAVIYGAIKDLSARLGLEIVDKAYCADEKVQLMTPCEKIPLDKIRNIEDINKYFDPKDEEMVIAHEQETEDMTSRHKNDQQEISKQHKQEKTSHDALKDRYEQFSQEFFKEHKEEKNILAENHKIVQDEMYKSQSQEDDLIFEAQQTNLNERKECKKAVINNVSRDILQKTRGEEDRLLNQERVIEDKYLNIDRQMTIKHILEDCTMLIRHEIEKYKVCNDEFIKGYIKVNIKHIRENMDMDISQEEEGYRLRIKHIQEERNLHDNKKREVRILEDRDIQKNTME